MTRAQTGLTVKEGRKIWLITGSSRGFGAALVTAVLESGDSVLATARHTEDIEHPSDEHRERFRTAPLDVTDPGAAEAAVAFAKAELGGLDVVVNNAGYANSASIEEMDPEDFRAQIEANLFGVVNVTRAALPVLRAQRSGYNAGPDPQLTARRITTSLSDGASSLATGWRWYGLFGHQ
jgi:NAD(P)-dependent dehydrogenase (short-subunit alcohol dehydrogenase family)